MEWTKNPDYEVIFGALSGTAGGNSFGATVLQPRIAHRLNGRADVIGALLVESARQRREATDHRLQAAAAVAFDVPTLPEGRRPDRYDFAAVATRLRERFPALS